MYPYERLQGVACTAWRACNRLLCCASGSHSVQHESTFSNTAATCTSHITWWHSCKDITHCTEIRSTVTVTPTMADCVVGQLEPDLTSALSMGVQRMQQNTNWRQWQWQSEDAVFRSASSFRWVPYRTALGTQVAWTHPHGHRPFKQGDPCIDVIHEALSRSRLPWPKPLTLTHGIWIEHSYCVLWVR